MTPRLAPLAWILVVSTGMALGGCLHGDADGPSEPPAGQPGPDPAPDPGPGPAPDPGPGPGPDPGPGPGPDPDPGPGPGPDHGVLEPQPGEGFAQKGPFQPGAQVSVQRLDLADGSPAGEAWLTQTGSDGLFRFTDIPWEGVAMVTVEGTWFDEVNNVFSGTTLRLRGVMDAAPDAPPSNVNLFTHLAARYVEYWMAEGYGYEECRGWAMDWLREWFGLRHDPDKLNLLDNLGTAVNTDSQLLLLYSAAAASLGLTQDELDTLAEEFAADDGWPTGEGLAIVRRLVDEVRDNGETLLATARQNLRAQFGRVFPFHGNMAWGVGICWFADILCQDGSVESFSVPGGSVQYIPIRTGQAGSYGIVVWHNQQSQLGFNLVGAATDAPLRSWSAPAGGFTEQPLARLPANADYRLRIDNVTNTTQVIDAWLYPISDGTKEEPATILPGDNAQQVGRSWGTVDNTVSYYQLIAGGGHYEVSLFGYPCGFATPAITLRAYAWEYDLTDGPLPEEVLGRNPFDNGTFLASSQEVACSQTLTIESDGNRSNRLYLSVQAEGPLRNPINSTLAAGNQITIAVRKL